MDVEKGYYERGIGGVDLLDMSQSAFLLVAFSKVH